MTRRLALLLSVAVLLSGCGISLQSLPKIGGISGPTYTLRATFHNVVNLPANAEVRVGAFQVGYVSGIQAQDFEAVVTMRIKSAEKLPVGTAAEIRFDTPLGEDYVQLNPPPGSGGVVQAASRQYLGPNTPIPAADTSTAPSVEDMLGALGLLLNQGGLNQLQTIIVESNRVFGGNQPQIHDLFNQLNTTVTSFATHEPALDNALQAIGSLSQELNQGSETITNGINAIQPAAAVLAGETGDFTRLVDQVNQLSQVANSIASQSANGTVDTMQQLGPVLDQLTSVQQQLGPALQAIDSFERLTPRTTPGDYLQTVLHATVQVPPVPPGALPLQKVTVDPPDANQSYQAPGFAAILEGGLP